MSSPMVSRWPILITVALGDGDLDANGRLTDSAARRCFDEATQDYLRRCTSVGDKDLELTRVDVRRREPVDGGGAVTVSAAVTEVFPDRFTMAVRIRGDGSGDVAADVEGDLTTGGELPKAARDEFIALAQAAAHYH